MFFAASRAEFTDNTVLLLILFESEICAGTLPKIPLNSYYFFPLRENENSKSRSSSVRAV